ncbi:DUF4374 domain-containing protein [Aquimarina muelleri]|uniref:DUF4374 domain-containing protein n=1 Tax=Aquimarina muelleri TaxID=279356 RepID=UPI003F682BC4
MKTNVSISIIAVLAIIFMNSCSSDDNPTPSIDVEKPYTLVTRVPGADVNSTSYYAQSIEKLSENIIYDNKDATEILSSDGAGVFKYDGALYLSVYIKNKSVVKWEPNQEGIFENKGSINITELGSAGNICFKDKNTAFVGGNDSDKLVIFDPTSMQRTGAIDLSSVSKVGTVTNYPEAGDKINAQVPTEMLIRGKYMFVSFFLLKEGLPSYTPASLTADILVIDLEKVDSNNTDNSDAIVKWISDERGVSLGSWNSGAGAKFMVKDEKDDIYLLCHNMWGNNRTITGKPACILRIKKGETDFDPSYYFDLETASRGNGSPVMNLEYAENGNFFAASIDFSAVDPDNPYSYYIDPISQWYKFNLYDKTAQIVNDQYTKGSLATITYSENGKIYIPYENKTESYILEVDSNTLESNKVITTAGTPGVYKLK